MKAIHLTLSLYLTLLALVPCQDGFALVPTDAPTAVHALDSEHNHSGDSEHEDHCTPFCMCACCGAVLDTPPTLLRLAATLPLPPKGSTQPCAVPNAKPGSFCAADWQPPRRG